MLLLPFTESMGNRTNTKAKRNTYLTNDGNGTERGEGGKTDKEIGRKRIAWGNSKTSLSNPAFSGRRKKESKSCRLKGH